ncbi:MAG: hypothetical protein AB7T17_08785 [Geobacter sp.]
MESKIPKQEQNFCRIFELPQQYPEGFLFNGGKPVTMLMIDWFNPWPHLLEPYKCPQTWDEVKALLLPWLLEKAYVQRGRKYLMITDFGESWIFGHAA